MRSNKATHSGHCQACGRLQKLPNGLLSKHGYTVESGFFSGTCEGSAKLPYEQSCDFVLVMLRRAMNSLAAHCKQDRLLRQRATESKCWQRVYVKDFRGRGHYAWRYVEVTADVRAFDYSPEARASGQTYVVFTRALASDEFDQRKSDINRHISARKHDERDVLAVCTEQNAQYADWLDRYEGNSLRRYIAYQRERIASWKLADLLPIETKDREGFVPSEPNR